MGTQLGLKRDSLFRDSFKPADKEWRCYIKRQITDYVNIRSSAIPVTASFSNWETCSQVVTENISPDDGHSCATGFREHLEGWGETLILLDDYQLANITRKNDSGERAGTYKYTIIKSNLSVQYYCSCLIYLVQLRRRNHQWSFQRQTRFYLLISVQGESFETIVWRPEVGIGLTNHERPAMGVNGGRWC